MLPPSVPWQTRTPSLWVVHGIAPPLTVCPPSTLVTVALAPAGTVRAAIATSRIATLILTLWN